MKRAAKIIAPLFCRVLPVVLLAGLAGCAQFKAAPQDESRIKAASQDESRIKAAPQDEYRIGVGTPQPAGEAVSLLYYFDYARGLSAADRTKETERMRLLHVRNKSDFHALQYAMLLSVPGGDVHRAQQLLEPLTREGGAQSRELRALALLLTIDLAERRRLEDGVHKADDLEKKLEALKNIEKNLIQRDIIDPGEKK